MLSQYRFSKRTWAKVLKCVCPCMRAKHTVPSCRELTAPNLELAVGIGCVSLEMWLEGSACTSSISVDLITQISDNNLRQHMETTNNAWTFCSQKTENSNHLQCPDFWLRSWTGSGLQNTTVNRHCPKHPFAISVSSNRASISSWPWSRVALALLYSLKFFSHICNCASAFWIHTAINQYCAYRHATAQDWGQLTETLHPNKCQPLMLI